MHKRLGGALRPQPKRRNGRPGPCPSARRGRLSMRGDALSYITIYRAVHGDRRVGSTCLRRRPLSRRVGSTCDLPPSRLGSTCASRRRVPLRRTRPPIVLRPAEVGGKRGLFVPGRISIGSMSMSAGLHSAGRSSSHSVAPGAPGHIAGSLRQPSAQRFMHAT